MNGYFSGRGAVLRLGLLAWFGLSASAGWSQTSFSSAQPISGQWGSVSYDNTGVTPDVGGPSPGGFVPHHPLWYQWTAPESGEVTLDTIGSVDAGGTNLDTVLAVYTGSDVSHLIQVAANDDYYPYWRNGSGQFLPQIIGTTFTYGFPIGNPSRYFGPLPLSGPSILRFNATAGTTYYIEVDSMPDKLSTVNTITTLGFLSRVGNGLISLNWAFRPSGVLRFATEEYDLFGWLYSSFFNPGGQPMPAPLYQCTESESLPGGGGYPGNATVYNSYYVFDPGGVLVTVTRLAGSSGRLWVDYTTADGTNSTGFGPLPAVAGVDYTPVSGTLVFDDFEMSKTIVIPIIGTFFYGTYTNDPTSPFWSPTFYDHDFQIILSNPRLDPLETTDVSPPRLDTPFAAATVRIMSGAGLGSDPNENSWTKSTPAVPSDDVYNFGKRNYRVPKDITDTNKFSYTKVNIGVFRTMRRVQSNSRSETLNYRVNNTVAAGATAQQYNNFFALNPGSEFAMPDPGNASPEIFPWGGSGYGAYTNYDFTLADGTVTVGNLDYGIISFTVTNNQLTSGNKDFNIVIWRNVDGADVSVGENNECHVTILCDDENPPAGSVDEFHNTDFGSKMVPAVPTVPSDQNHPGTDGNVWAIAVQPDGRTILAGEFTTYNGTPRSCIARATPGGPIDTSFYPGTGADDGIISSLSLLPDGSGKMMIGGTFNFYNTSYTPFIARLTPNGQLDPTFAPTIFPDGPVWALAIQTNNQVIVVGDFLNVGSIPRSHVARYNANGSLDSSFDPGANAPDGSLFSVALQPDGKLVIGGAFANLGSQPLGGLARLNADGTADTAFNTNLGFGVDGVVETVVIQGGSKIVIGGEFQNVVTAQRTRIARLNSDGTVDQTFNSGTGADDTIYNISAQPDGSMYVGGLFTTFNGTHRLGFTRLYADGTVDTTFLDTAYNQFAGLHRKYYDRQWSDPFDPDPNPEARPYVRASQVLPNGEVVIGGSFSQVGGGQAYAPIRFDSDYPTNTPDPNVWTEPKARDGVRNRSNFAQLIGGATPGPGNIGLLYTNYTINKSQLALNVDLLRTNGTLGFASANFALQSGLAQSGVDYVYNSVPPTYLGSWWPAGYYEPYDSTFLNSRTRLHSDGLFLGNTIPTDIYGHTWFPYLPGTLAITIKHGQSGNVGTQVQLANPSGADQFFLGGQNMPLGLALGASSAPLTIVDDSHNSGVIGFAAANSYVNENAGSAIITITRTNGSDLSPSVTFSTVDGSAHAGSNYVAYTQRITFRPGQTSTNIAITVKDDGASEPNGLTVGLRLTSVSGASLGLASATLNILDTDSTPGSLIFSSATYITNESSGAVVLEVDRRGANRGTLSVQCITTNGTAINGTHYVGIITNLSWSDSDPVLARYVTIPLINDGLAGPTTFFGAYLTNAIANTTNAPGVLANSPNGTRVTIIDDNYYGSLQFSALSYHVSENGGYITIPVIRTGGSSESLIVTYSTADGPLASSSGPLPNYVAVTNTLTFGPGEVCKTFNVSILDDGVTNGPPNNFWFTVNLSQPSQPGILGYPSSALVYIVDAEAFLYPAGSPDPNFVPNPGFNGDVSGVAVQTNSQIVVAGDFTVANNYPRNRVARLNSDSTLDTTFLDNLPGANGPIQTLQLQTDGRILVAGTFSQFNNLNRNGLARLMSDGTLDSSFNSGAGGDSPVYSIAEMFMPDRRLLIGGSFLHMNGVSHPGLARLNNAGLLDPSFDPNLNVNGIVYAMAVYPTNTVQGGKILIGGSFSAVNGVPRPGVARLFPDGTLDTAFDPGAGATNAVRALAIQPDGLVLVGGSFTNFNGYALNHIARLNVNGQVDTSFNGGAGTDDTVDAIVVQPDTRILLAGLFTHASGVSRNRLTRLLPDGTVDPAINFGQGADSYVDALALQPDGMRMVIGGGFTSYDGQPRSHLARVYGGSLAGSGSFRFTQANFEADELSTNAVLTVRRTGGTAGDMAVNFTTVGLTAVPGTNFLNVQTNLVFPTGETFQSVSVPVIHDFTITPDLVVSNYLSNPTPPAAIGNQSWALLTILNDDSTVNFSSDSYSVYQNNLTGPFYVNVVRQGSTRSNAFVTFFTATNSTAVYGVDYTVATNTVLTIPSGSTNVLVPVSILNNPAATNDVTVVMQLSNAVNAVLSLPSQTTLTILATNQSPGQLMFAQTNYFASEAAGFLTATVVRTNGHYGRVRADFSTVNGTAQAGQSYVATNGNLTFEDGETSKSFPVQIIENPLIVGNQTFSLVLSNASGGATLTYPTKVPVTIVDDKVGLTFVQPVYVLRETSGNVSLSVYRQNGTNAVTTVHYSTTNDTAQAGVNYVGITDGTLTFPPGVLYTNIVINLLHDPKVTGDLKFNVNLFNPSAPAQLGTPASATVVIQDAESGISIASTNLVVITNDDLSLSTNASFGVFKSSGTNLPISIVVSNVNNGTLAVGYATADGTALAGVNYVTNGGTLTFSNGVPYQAVGIQIISNQVIEGDRTFTFYLTNTSPTNVAFLLTPYAATITITDDTAGLSFSSPTYTTSENNQQGATVTVFRSNYTNNEVKVGFFTADGSGLAGTNYWATNGTLVFNPGETVKTFTVLPMDNHTVDGNHTVQLYLTNAVGVPYVSNTVSVAAGGAVLVNPTNATVLILETDGSLILPAGVALLSESGPVNGVIDVNETVSLLFGLRNANGTNTANLMATLLATNGVTNVSSPQVYGQLVAHGPSVSRQFTFTANATNGQVINAVLQLSDGGRMLSNAVFSFAVGKTPVISTNSSMIVINDDAQATPYPSVITVSNLNGLVTQATVTLTNLIHNNPRDIDALLVSPTGQKVLLMSHCGGTMLAYNTTLTFDDTATNVLPQLTQITNGTYRPSAYGALPIFPPAPAPFRTNDTAAPFANNLGVVNGTSPNGAWALYVIDDNPLFSGSIANGWTLNLMLTGPVPGAADLALGMSASASSVVATSNLTYTVAVTNAGPAGATNIVVTDTLPVGAVLVGTNSTQGSATAAAGVVTWNVGSLAYGARAYLSLVVQAPPTGPITNLATVTTTTVDPNPDDDSASAITTVIAPTADLALGMEGFPDPVLLGYNLSYTLTVNNVGPATASGVTVVDALPTGVNFVSASPSGAFTRVGQIVTFDLGNVASNGQATVTIVVQPTVLGTLLNSATCSSSVTDPSKANNHASAKTVVDPVVMTFAHVPGGLEVSWPASSNYMLQGATNLHPPTIWMPVTNVVPVKVGNQMVVVIPIGPGDQFFRLFLPTLP